MQLGNYFWALFLTLFIAGCTSPTRAPVAIQSEDSAWRGRLAVRVESDQPTSISAEFELSGTPQAGELTLYTPLGMTAAALAWSSQTAVMRANGDVRYYESLDALIMQAVGVKIPVTGLFAWLAGDDMKVDGWNADLSQHALGRITARRIEPLPLAELRIVLER